MANQTPWADRSGAQRRRTFRTFAVVYGAIALGLLVIGAVVVGVLFGVAALVLVVLWMNTAETDPAPRRDRPKPDWMLRMEDPDAPDLSLPEYRTTPRPPVERTGDTPTVTEGADEIGPLPTDDAFRPPDPPGAPPSPGV